MIKARAQVPSLAVLLQQISLDLVVHYQKQMFKIDLVDLCVKFTKEILSLYRQRLKIRNIIILQISTSVITFKLKSAIFMYS